MSNEEKILKKLTTINNSIKRLESKIEKINKVLLPPLKELHELDKERIRGGIKWEDELLIDACKVVLEYDRASASLIQRRLGIGYARATRLLDEMAFQGLIVERKVPHLSTYTKVVFDRKVIEDFVKDFESTK